MSAYSADVLAVICPRCHALEGDRCVNPITKKASRCPCLLRLQGTAA